MGNVPSLDDVVNGRLPKPEDYPRAVSLVEEGIKEMHSAGKIYCGSVYGSSKNHQARIGSDIDVLVIAYDISGCLPELREIRTRVAAMHIDAEINPLISVRQAREGKHGIEGRFGEYLEKRGIADSLIGPNPFVNLIKPADKSSWLKEFIALEESNLRRMTRDSTLPLFSKEHCKFLARMLNYTLFIPLEMYSLKYGKIFMEDMSKPALVRMYQEEFPDMDSLALNNSIYFWHKIDEILRQPVVDLDAYWDLLSWYAGRYGTIEEFILSNIALAEKLERVEHDLMGF